MILRLLLAALVACVPTLTLVAQGNRQAPADLSSAKPGRAPNQAIDEAYTAKIKEYTTEPFFLSPLVDYLPASRTVPTPSVVLVTSSSATSTARSECSN
jgi:hypothetical protein